jgi:hypothetical protein
MGCSSTTFKEIAETMALTVAAVVGFHIAGDNFCVRAKLKGQVHWHSRMNPEATGFVTARSNHAATAATSNNEWFASQPWIVFALYCNKEGIQIEVYNVSFHATN